ncbi:MAG: hypothetical protein LC114_03735 [Bryobacterales bacterium]|nr:hypothetical protein [Bryobacterales bacterium]
MPIRSPVLGENTRFDFRISVHDGSLRAAVLPVAATEQHNDTATPRTSTNYLYQRGLNVFLRVVVRPVVSMGVPAIDDRNPNASLWRVLLPVMACLPACARRG